jgi:endonuclease YncB( thermonuclease family)
MLANAAPSLARVAAAIALASVAQADPCDATLPRRGESFSGPVTRVIDGDSICIGHERGGIEVRVAEYSAPELRDPSAALRWALKIGADFGPHPHGNLYVLHRVKPSNSVHLR